VDGNQKELILPNHEFNRQKKVISRSINLKWNYSEFQVKHTCLSQKYLVWKYYLTKLLQEKNLDEKQRPYFTCTISQPITFWNELKIRFMSTFDHEEQRIILKTMCVLYSINFAQLKDLKSMSYWIKLLDLDQYSHCHFIILQLLHIALAVKGEIGKKNLKRFIKHDGMVILKNSMKFVFRELHRQDASSFIRGPNLDNFSSQHTDVIIKQTGPERHSNLG